MPSITPRPAASVIAVRRNNGCTEVLLVKRNASLAFLGDTWVFPGGKIDPQDQTGSEEASARKAACRELQEETALLIEQSVLLPFSHWTTPTGGSHRYATWFYLGAVGHDDEVVVDGSEIVDHRWAPAAELLAQQARGELRLSAPTYVSLWQLDQHALRVDRLQLDSLPDFTRYRPRIAALENGCCALYEGDAGYDSTDIEVAGPRHRLWMISDGWRYERD